MSTVIGANAEARSVCFRMLSRAALRRLEHVVPAWIVDAPTRFRDRRDAGRSLVSLLRDRDLNDAVVVGLARGGVVVASEIAAELGLPLDAVAVRKIGHPLQPEFAIGAVAGDGVYLRHDDDVDPEERDEIVKAAKWAAIDLDRRLHSNRPPVDLAGRTALLVDDGLATGATMIAAVRWARGVGAARVIAVVPVGAAATLELVAGEADEMICPLPVAQLVAVGVWYERFEQVDDDEVMRHLEAASSRDRCLNASSPRIASFCGRGRR